MKSPIHFYCRAYDSVANLELPAQCIIFHGNAVDERGSSAIELVGSHAMVQVSYDPQRMVLSLNAHEVSADLCEQEVKRYLDGRPVVLEATTLGFAELFCLVRSLRVLGIESFQILYAEPSSYFKPSGATDAYELSDMISGYHPIPHAIIDLSSQEVESGVFFLGYEEQRMAQALEEYQMIADKNVKVVFGVPAFRAGWELNAIVPHLQLLLEQSNLEVGYCCASDPASAFQSLQSTRESLSVGTKMFIAPIGPKPCGVASALFAAMYPEQTGILFDHPKKKSKRSSGVHTWHQYSVRFLDGKQDFLTLPAPEEEPSVDPAG